MDKALASAVLTSFRDGDSADQRGRLQGFSTRRWMRSLDWLDGSGLALYWLERLRAFQIEDAIPDQLRREMEQRQADNRGRTEALFEEFVRLNAAFHDAGLLCVNLKGFTLAPDYCFDITLRYQMDFDFLIAERDASKSQAVLNALGYAPVAINRHVLEFKTDAGRTPSLRELYKARPERSVEVHLSQEESVEFHPRLLEEHRWIALQGGQYRALTAEDIFVGQACHIFRHLRSEWTRVSWLLEFKNCIARRHTDQTFWHAVQSRAGSDPTSRLALSVSVRMAREIFKACLPGELTSLIESDIPNDITLWIERYGKDALLADFPGSKLYLILERAIAGEEGASRIRERLFPRRPPAPIVPVPTGRLLRLQAWWTGVVYLYVRLRFHITAGLRYFVAVRRWKQFRVRAKQDELPCSHNRITNIAR